MVAGVQSRFPALAADRASADADSLTSPLKTRVGVFRRRPSGRLSSRGRGRSMFTPGSRACAYKTASGRGNWPSIDPINEAGFKLCAGRGNGFYSIDEKNLYGFLGNAPLDYYDANGLNPVAACAIGIALAPIEVPAAAIITGTVAIGGTIYITWKICERVCRPKKCLPCSPAVGSIAYRVDMPPSPAHNGIPTPHSRDESKPCGGRM